MAGKAPTSNLPFLKGDLQVSIYVRNYAKKAVMMVLPSRIRMNDFQEKITRKMKVDQENQALFLHGSLIPNSLQEIELHNQGIFHLVILKRVYLPDISISIKRIEPHRPSYRYQVPSSMTIAEFLRKRFS